MIMKMITLLILLINIIMIRECKLDINKYMDRLERAYPNYTRKEIEEILIARVEYWEMIIDNINSF